MPENHSHFLLGIAHWDDMHLQIGLACQFKSASSTPSTDLAIDFEEGAIRGGESQLLLAGAPGMNNGMTLITHPTGKFLGHPWVTRR